MPRFGEQYYGQLSVAFNGVFRWQQAACRSVFADLYNALCTAAPINLWKLSLGRVLKYADASVVERVARQLMSDVRCFLTIGSLHGGQLSVLCDLVSVANACTGGLAVPGQALVDCCGMGTGLVCVTFSCFQTQMTHRQCQLSMQIIYAMLLVSSRAAAEQLGGCDIRFAMRVRMASSDVHMLSSQGCPWLGW
jgi:hypothetical protein